MIECCLYNYNDFKDKLDLTGYDIYDAVNPGSGKPYKHHWDNGYDSGVTILYKDTKDKMIRFKDENELNDFINKFNCEYYGENLIFK